MDLSAFFAELANVWPRLLQGSIATITVSFQAIAIGSVFGSLLGLVMFYGRMPTRICGWIYLDFIRGTPVLVLMLASFYIVPLVGLGLSSTGAGILALSAFCAAHVAEVFRGGLAAVPPGQAEAAKSIGLTFPKILFYVLLPQVLRQALPAWINAAVEIVKASSLLAVISVPELLLTTQQIVSRNFMNAEFYLVCGLIYFAINLTLSKFGKLVEKRLAF
ncbi:MULTISPECIES: amino acid ABC transporter permease [Kaistia]|uniref:Amino acid ABC transporter permease n=1 Tax=Kaistia nematophila TaxID=2994654 RepID=A0A9X3E4E7_9HYPH|nr:amino acid ABC transporter permease [Kaistia nematophila]MBN9024732.1 amino acid ABC transporter permease [Hyphomicrobiales bacterium]MBN9058803.1 amino acid ABC transporter permease [Hyphomicrobiales bacterium]MCX5571364.1 amino acid ABC transporter permease [Kaistia nematophila]